MTNRACWRLAQLLIAVAVFAATFATTFATAFATNMTATSGAVAAQTRLLPASSTQIVLALADTWSATTVTVRRFAKTNGRWKLIGRAIPARIGPTGLAWGSGLLPTSALANDPAGHPGKVEGDSTAPVGVFPLGPVFAYDMAWAKKTAMPFVHVGTRDLFVEDPESPLYNTHVRLDHEPRTTWEKHEQMEQGDPAHRLKIFVGHNADPPIAGRGSAIFLHVWRGDGSVLTAGCTSMRFTDLSTIVQWLRPEAHPLYVLLPVSLYRTLRDDWQLPEVS